MISGKGILITVLTASAAAAIVGSLLTKERSQSIRRLVDKVRRFTGASGIDKAGSDALQGGSDDLARAGNA